MDVKKAFYVSLTAAITTFTSFVLALLTVFYERSFQGVVGNLCEQTLDNPGGLCYEELPKGGFPLAFLYDAEGTSVIGQLGFEDDLRFLPLLADTVFFAVALSALSFALFALIRRVVSPKSF